MQTAHCHLLACICVFVRTCIVLYLSAVSQQALDKSVGKSFANSLNPTWHILTFSHRALCGCLQQHFLYFCIWFLQTTATSHQPLAPLLFCIFNNNTSMCVFVFIFVGICKFYIALSTVQLRGDNYRDTSWQILDSSHCTLHCCLGICRDICVHISTFICGYICIWHVFGFRIFLEGVSDNFGRIWIAGYELWL